MCGPGEDARTSLSGFLKASRERAQIKKAPGTHLNIFSVRKRYTTGLRTFVSTLVDDLAVAFTSTVFT
ncbi:MAG TPA: hypothetical protein VKA08_00870, partial [Balneolales bacterium]|nr:hypothetical protein [Balneolales bacterium]